MTSRNETRDLESMIPGIAGGTAGMIVGPLAAIGYVTHLSPFSDISAGAATVSGIVGFYVGFYAGMFGGFAVHDLAKQVPKYMRNIVSIIKEEI